MQQLLLFEDPLEKRLIRQIDELKERYEKLRKGQYAKIAEVKKETYELRHEVETLKEVFCGRRES